MKTYEELKSMATEDLVRYVMETQEELAEKSEKLERISEIFSSLENESYRFNRVLREALLDAEL